MNKDKIEVRLEKYDESDMTFKDLGCLVSIDYEGNVTREKVDSEPVTSLPVSFIFDNRNWFSRLCYKMFGSFYK